MRGLLRDRLVLAWVALALVTLLSSQLGGHHWLKPMATSIAVLTMAFAKAGVVMFEFMELRQAPRLLKALALAWLVIVLAVLLAVLGNLLP